MKEWGYYFILRTLRAPLKNPSLAWFCGWLCMSVWERTWALESETETRKRERVLREEGGSGDLTGYYLLHTSHSCLRLPIWSWGRAWEETLATVRVSDYGWFLWNRWRFVHSCSLCISFDDAERPGGLFLTAYEQICIPDCLGPSVNPGLWPQYELMKYSDAILLLPSWSSGMSCRDFGEFFLHLSANFLHRELRFCESRRNP